MSKKQQLKILRKLQNTNLIIYDSNKHVYISIQRAALNSIFKRCGVGVAKPDNLHYIGIEPEAHKILGYRLCPLFRQFHAIVPTFSIIGRPIYYHFRERLVAQQSSYEKQFL